MTKKELALETVARLKKEYPDAGCTLEYEDAWKLLIASCLPVYEPEVIQRQVQGT